MVAALFPELEGYAAKRQRKQHDDDRRVQRGHDDRVGKRKHRKKPAAAKHQPGLVTIPHGRYRIHHAVPILLVRHQREQDAHAKVKTVKYDIGQHREGDEARPDQCVVDGHGFAPRVPAITLAGTSPAARIGPSFAGCGAVESGELPISRTM